MMKTASRQTPWLAHQSTRKVLRRVAGATAVLAVLVAAIGVPVMSPQPNPGTNPVLAIARADCPPDCGGGPGNGGTPTGPPGGGTEFIPPSIPAMPSYEPGRGQPPLDQNNGISIYNSAAPQHSQPAQPNQAAQRVSSRNPDGTYSRDAQGNTMPIQQDPEENIEPSSEWKEAAAKLNQSREFDKKPGDNDDPLHCKPLNAKGDASMGALRYLGVDKQWHPLLVTNDDINWIDFKFSDDRYGVTLTVLRDIVVASMEGQGDLTMPIKAGTSLVFKQNYPGDVIGDGMEWISGVFALRIINTIVDNQICIPMAHLFVIDPR